MISNKQLRIKDSIVRLILNYDGIIRQIELFVSIKMRGVEYCFVAVLLMWFYMIITMLAKSDPWF